ncbi:pentapeptide repeat-containing protein [Mycobacterium sp. E3305]|uniref:pentapeptide repeat-containing protein n=1 Tax=Mycobacterium sp. E3305 TaxID=1834145 RepID=UPI0007FDFC12|nr:pentapeptide repeat-containing protein [Mycobacterium sp. E3305]OBG79097.1 hypothetical protein A5701_14440 [Mycobacterium sp. E3305]
MNLRNDQGRIRLVLLVLVGTVTVVIAGGALFLWFAWLLSRQPATWTTWLGHVDGQGWFDAAKTTAAILAIIGVGGAALVSYRRQDTAEQTHSLETERHKLESQRLQDDRERELRSRFTTIAEQLSGKSAIRLAGAYALAALADDWHRFGNDDERQVCVSLMCAQLRREPEPDDPDSKEIRNTIIGIIRQHRPRHSDPANESDWGSCKLDLDGADLTNSSGLFNINFDGVYLSRANLSGVWLVGCNMVRASLIGAQLQQAFIAGDLTRARLAHADLSDATISANLTGCDLGWANLSGADLSGSNLTDADLENATLDGVLYDDKTIWPEGFTPPRRD